MPEDKWVKRTYLALGVIFATLIVTGAFVYIGYLYDREVPARSAKAIEFIKKYKTPLGKDVITFVTVAEKLLEKIEPKNFRWRSERRPFSYEKYEVILEYDAGDKTKSCSWTVDTNKMQASDSDECAEMISLLEEKEEGSERQK